MIVIMLNNSTLSLTNNNISTYVRDEFLMSDINAIMQTRMMSMLG